MAHRTLGERKPEPGREDHERRQARFGQFEIGPHVFHVVFPRAAWTVRSKAEARISAPTATCVVVIETSGIRQENQPSAIWIPTSEISADAGRASSGSSA